MDAVVKALDNMLEKIMDDDAEDEHMPTPHPRELQEPPQKGYINPRELQEPPQKGYTKGCATQPPAAVQASILPTTFSVPSPLDVQVAEGVKGLLGMSHTFNFCNTTRTPVVLLLEEDPEGILTKGKLSFNAGGGPTLVGDGVKIGVGVEAAEIRKGPRPVQELIVSPGINKSHDMKSDTIFVTAAFFRHHGGRNSFQVFKSQLALKAGSLMQFLDKHLSDPHHIRYGPTLAQAVQGNQSKASGSGSSPVAGLEEVASPKETVFMSDQSAARPMVEEEEIKGNRSKFLGNELQVSASVKAFSQTAGVWLDAEVVGIALDDSCGPAGSLHICYRRGGETWIFPKDITSRLRKP